MASNYNPDHAPYCDQPAPAVHDQSVPTVNDQSASTPDDQPVSIANDQLAPTTHDQPASAADDQPTSIAHDQPAPIAHDGTSDNFREPEIDLTPDLMGAMTLTQMEDLLTKAALTPDQITTLIKRIQTVSKAQETLQKMKHLREDEHDSDYRSKKHRDVNYTQVEALKLTSSIREWSDWKADLDKVFRGAPFRYKNNDNGMIIAANEHMDKDCRTLWNTHLKEIPEMGGNWEHFLDWTKTLIQDSTNFQPAIHDLWQSARQRPNQSPTDFNAYLSALEREMEPQTEYARALTFLSKLRYELKAQIRMTGVNPLPQTRQAMVSLASRVWQGMTSKPPRRNGSNGSERSRGGFGKTFNQNHQVDQASPVFNSPYRGTGRGRGYYRGFRGGRYKGRFATRGGYRVTSQFRERRPQVSQFTSGVNDKGEPICYKCGSTEHFSYDCPDNKKIDQKEIKPKNNPGVRMVQTAADVTDTESESENE